MKSIIVITEFGTMIYSSIEQASLQTGISRTRISRALNHHNYGLIANTEPPVCVEAFDETSENKPDSLPCKECLKCPFIKGGSNA